MLQYMVALAVRERAPDCRLANVQLPEWGIVVPPVPIVGERFDHREPRHGGVLSLAALLAHGGVGGVELSGFNQQVTNLLPPASYREVFRAASADAIRTGDGDLVINIGGGARLAGGKPHHVLVPIDFYAHLIFTTGLSPLFMGQIDDNPYCDALRGRFPAARFEPSRGAIADIQTLRLASNVVPSISVFSWVACWLSTAARIFLPLLGMFNPMQWPAGDFCPADDARFRFFWFPASYAVPVANFADSHATLANAWKPIAFHELDDLRGRAPLHPRRKDSYVALFDASFYLHRYPDLARLPPEKLLSPLQHYIRQGFYENREAFHVDRPWYTRTYAQAAWEIGRGEFLDPQHHFAEAGHARGYRPAPR